MRNCLLRFDINSNIDLRFLGHINYTHPWQHFHRKLDEYVLYIIKRGELFIEEARQKHHLKENDYFLLEPGLSHSGYQKSTCHYYYIHFNCNGISHETTNPNAVKDIIIEARNKIAIQPFHERNKWDNIHIYFPKHHNLHNPGEIFNLLKHANHAFYENLEGHRKMAALKIHELLILIARDYFYELTNKNTPESMKKVKEIKDYIHSNYFMPIDSNSIASRFNTNYDYINRVFKSVTGYTIWDYIIYQRINAAKYLLEVSCAKISEIGYMVGMDDPYYFSAFFKKYTGITPSQYRHLKRR